MEKEIKQSIKKLTVNSSDEIHGRILDKLLKVMDKSNKQTAIKQPNIWRAIAKNKITQLAAAIVVVLAACWLIVSDKSKPEQHKTTGLEIAVISETPAELVSVITLNTAFQNGGMQAMEKQFEKAEEKVKPGLKTRLTVDELICELYGC